VLSRGDVRFPALVTQLRRPNGFTSTATYDARGNLQTSTDLSPFGTGVNVATTFTWDPLWDFVTRINRSGGLPSDTMEYDSRGNRTLEQTGPDTTRRVHYTYDSIFHLVASVQTALQTVIGATVAQRIGYDTLGNVVTTTTPGGLVARYRDDDLGKLVLDSVPLDVAQTIYRSDSTSYDVADRPVRTVTFGPTRNGLAADNAIVAIKYDAEGNIVSTRRSTSPDVANIGTLRDSSVYDPAHRKVKAIAVDNLADSLIYDPSGNIDAMLTRGGSRVNSTYDVLNRIVQQVTTAVVYPRVRELTNTRTFPHYPNASDSSLTLGADTAVFAYNANGNPVRADNYAAQIRRSYMPNGMIATDTQVVRTYSTSASQWGDTLQHRYVLRYTYDDAGRRSVLQHPASLSSGSTGTTIYGYDPVMGQLQQITDPLSNVFTLTEDADGRPVRTQYPGGVRDTTRYDSEGDISELTTLNTTARGSMFFQIDTLYDAVLTREGQGRVTNATFGGLSPAPASDMSYGGLGELVNTAATNGFQVFDQLSGQFIPATAYEANVYTLDALGNQVKSTRTSSADVSGPDVNHPDIDYHELPFTDTTTYIYDSLGVALGRGRLRQRTVSINSSGVPESEILQYDLEGNIARDSTRVGTTAIVTHSY
jgi:YD repeat-containing protein